MSDQQPQNQTGKREKGAWRIIALLAVIAILGFGWNWAWQQAADKLDTLATSRITRLSDKGTEIACTNRSIIGYPFRIGLHCDSLSIFTTSNGLKLDAGEFRSAAQFYKPGHAIAELEAPLTAETPGGEKVSAIWENLKASIIVGIGGWKRISIEASFPRGNGNLSSFQGFEVSADEIQLHARAPDESSRADGLDLAASAINLNMKGLAKIPAANVTANLALEQIGAHIEPGFNLRQYLRQYGISGEARELAVMPIGGGRFAVSGPFEISSAGLLSGKLTLEFTDTARLLAFAAAAGGDAGWLAQAGQVLSMIPASSDGSARKITLNIQDGAVSAGFFKLGEIPSLF